MLMQRVSSVHFGGCSILQSLSLGLMVYACSYDAHPMAILTSAFAYLGSYYSEANPSLQGTIFFYWLVNFDHCISLGQKLYTGGNIESLTMIDRQIYRLIGKATTLAA